jgi:hypothetical protein
MVGTSLLHSFSAQTIPSSAQLIPFDDQVNVCASIWSISNKYTPILQGRRNSDPLFGPDVSSPKQHGYSSLHRSVPTLCNHENALSLISTALSGMWIALQFKYLKEVAPGVPLPQVRAQLSAYSPRPNQQ